MLSLLVATAVGDAPITDNGTVVNFTRYVSINAVGGLGQSLECSGGVYSGTEVKSSGHFVNDVAGYRFI